MLKSFSLFISESKLSQERMKQIASEHDSTDGTHWQHVQKYPLSNFHDARERGEWFKKTVVKETDPENRERLHKIAHKPSKHPVVIYKSHKNETHVWDGNHRIGAAVARGDTHIHAIVGRSK